MTEYSVKVDWFSFTVPVSIPESTTPDKWLERVKRTLEEFMGDWWYGFAIELEWEHRNGRRPYLFSIASTVCSFTIFHSPRIDNILVEIGGTGMDVVRSFGLQNEFFERASSRATRVDIAVDFRTDVRPTEFVDAGYSARIKARGEAVSDTGETKYVGSPKSDQRARVYRYNAPHPRSDLTRVEMVAKKKRAKQVAHALTKDTVSAVAAAMSKAYGWQHPLWELLDTEPAEFDSIVGSKSDQDTIYWFVKQVVPAFKRLVQDGTIKDPEKWLERTFLKELENDTIK